MGDASLVRTAQRVQQYLCNFPRELCILSCMRQFLELLAFVGVYLFVVRWVLPRLGVPT